MSSSNNKESKLARLKRQMKNQKQKRETKNKNIFKIPTNDLSKKEKRKKGEKTYLPTIDMLTKISVEENELRRFLSEVNILRKEDFISESASSGETVLKYENKIVNDGYQFYKKTIKDRNTTGIDISIKEANKNWLKFNIMTKITWVLKAYSNITKPPLGIKIFIETITNHIHSKEMLNRFINDYLSSFKTYNKFIDEWEVIQTDGDNLLLIEKKAKEKAEKNNYPIEDLLGTKIEVIPRLERIALSEEENRQLNKKKEKLDRYKDSLEKIQQEISNKRKEKLVEKIIELSGQNLSSKDRYMRWELNELEQRLDSLGYENEGYWIEKEKLDINYKKRLEELKNKIATLSLEIHNLGLGKILFHKKEKILGFKELLYKSKLEMYIRKLELEKWSEDKLLSYYRENIPEEDNKQLSKKEMIDNILISEFSASTRMSKMPKINKNKLHNVLLTLSEKQLHILAISYGILNPERRGIYQNIEKILLREFQTDNKPKSTKQLVLGTSNWSYSEREKELLDKSPKEIKEIASNIGLNINKGVKIDNLIKGILSREKRLASLVYKEDAEKEILVKKIIELTGQTLSSKDRYMSWTLNELEQRLDSLGYENEGYWIELEKEKLVKKLSQLTDINSDEYFGISKWNIKKLRKKLRQLSGFIIHDQKENKFDRKPKETQSSKIKDILSSLVSEKSKLLATNILSQELTAIAPMKKDYGIITLRPENNQNTVSKFLNPNTFYMKILITKLLEGTNQTNRELFTNVANIIVYLNIPEAKIFRKNIELEYYIPDILATLSPAEKFPEIYDDPNIDERIINQLTSVINNKIFKLVNQMAVQFYKQEDQTRRSDELLRTTYDYKIKTQQRLSACVNKDRVKDASPEEIIYYKENGEIYCFTVDELYERFLNNNYVNPETNNKFNDKFIQRFEELYNKKLTSDGFLEIKIKDLEEKLAAIISGDGGEDDITVEMEDLRKEIEEMKRIKYKEEYEESIDVKEKNNTVKKIIPKISSDLWGIVGEDIRQLEDELSNEKPADGDEIDEDRENERRDGKDVDQEDVCVYCRNHIYDDSIKTLVKHKNESRIIKFCSFKCFEDKNDWEKFKKQKNTNQRVKKNKEKKTDDKTKKDTKKPKKTDDKKDDTKKSKKTDDKKDDTKKSKKTDDKKDDTKKSKKTDDKKDDTKKPKKTDDKKDDTKKPKKTDDKKDDTKKPKKTDKTKKDDTKKPKKTDKTKKDDTKKPKKTDKTKKDDTKKK